MMRAIRSPSRRRNWLAGVGLACGLVGAIGYFAVVLLAGHRMPAFRDDPVADLVLIAIGLGCSFVAIRRAWARPPAYRGRILAPLLGIANVAVAGVFVWYLSVFSAVVPPNGPTLGQPAPSFALPDEHGVTRTLGDYRGAPLLLVFYRGHW